MKEKPSKLDAFTERLDEWFGIERKTLAEVQDELKADGCEISLARLSVWWSRRSEYLQGQQTLAAISTGSQQCKEVTEAFGKNPPPDLETLIKLHRVLIMKLSTAAVANPDLLSAASAMMKPMIAYAKVQESAAARKVNENRLVLEEKKFQRETCEMFLKWWGDKKVKEIVSGEDSNDAKTEQLGQRIFGEDWK